METNEEEVYRKIHLFLFESRETKERMEENQKIGDSSLFSSTSRGNGETTEGQRGRKLRRAREKGMRKRKKKRRKKKIEGVTVPRPPPTWLCLATKGNYGLNNHFHPGPRVLFVIIPDTLGATIVSRCAAPSLSLP